MAAWQSGGLLVIAWLMGWARIRGVFAYFKDSVWAQIIRPENKIIFQKLIEII